MKISDSLKKGSHRDNAILAIIERLKCLDAEQVELLFFRELAQGQRVAQRRLKRLTELKRVKRGRFDVSHPYHYYMNKPGQVEHALAVGWAYVWISLTCKRWEQVHCFYLETDYGTLRADALAAVKNTVTGTMRVYFVEVDLSNNSFDKVSKYNALYASGSYASAWWVPLVKRFPAILVFTTGESRRTTIRREVERHNINGLEFRVYLLSKVREECLSRGRRGGVAET